jgi:hypothetical protein
MSIEEAFKAGKAAPLYIGKNKLFFGYPIIPLKKEASNDSQPTETKFSGEGFVLKKTIRSTQEKK